MKTVNLYAYIKWGKGGIVYSDICWHVYNDSGWKMDTKSNVCGISGANGTLIRSILDIYNNKSWVGITNDTSYLTFASWFEMNTSVNDWNITITNVSIQEGAPPVGDTCDCTSIQAGTIVNCAENCIVDGAVCNAGGLNVRFNGAGLVTLTTDIKNYGKVIITGGCTVRCIGGCFKK